MTIYGNTLDQLRTEQTLVDLYRDHLDDETLTGYITEYTEDFVYMSLFSKRRMGAT